MKSKILLLYTLTITCSFNYMVNFAASDAGLNLLNEGCSSINVSSVPNFISNLNASFNDLKTQISAGKRFATSERLSGLDSVYAMLQCRNYMSTDECIQCFTAASTEIRRNCSAAIGGRVIYDGCFLRYERTNFYGETTGDNVNAANCGGQDTSAPVDAFKTTVEGLLNDLATPKIKDLFAASRREVVGANNVSVYGIAQCVQTINSTGCLACMQVALTNILRCPPDKDGRAVDSGCFMRYSDSPFFPNTGSSFTKAGLTGGVAVGVALLLLIVV